MNKGVELGLTALALIIVAVFGAFVSKWVRTGQLGWYWTYASGFLAISVWAYQSRSKTLSLGMASLLYDTIYNTAWFVTLLFLGEKFTFTQVTGIALIMFGLTLLGG